MSDWLPDSKPDWAKEAGKLANDPDGYVLGIVAGWIVSGFWSAGSALVDATRAPFDAVLLIFPSLEGAFTAALQPVDAAVVGLEVDLTAAVYGLTQWMGPLAPFAAALLMAVTVYLLYRLVTDVAPLLLPWL